MARRSARIPFGDFHRLPGETPQHETNLRAGELVTAVELPAQGFAANYTYLKIRDRLSYAFALVSVAVGLELDGSTIKEARFALGGVAHKPWRRPEAEATRGKTADEIVFRQAADLAVRDAKGFGHNEFKIDLARRTIIRALFPGSPRNAAVAVQQKDRVSKPMAPYIGTPTSRVDGIAKVTGAAKYAAEFNLPGLVHASVVGATIAKGRIMRIDVSAATHLKGVLTVLTHEHRPWYGQ